MVISLAHWPRTREEVRRLMMADAPADNTEWVVVKHTRFPIVADEVVGHYSTEADANKALNDLLRTRQWFTEYGVEHRLKGYQSVYERT